MVRCNLGYSDKNIPIGSQKEYMLLLESQAKKFMRNLEWKAYFYLNPDARGQKKETSGFGSDKNAKFNPLMKDFREDFVEKIKKHKI